MTPSLHKSIGLLLGPLLFSSLSHAQTNTPLHKKTSMTDSNKAIVQQLYADCLNKHDFSLLPQFISETYTAVNGQKGAVGFESTIGAITKAFADAHWQVEEVIGEHDKVYIRWNFRGTHTGLFQGIAPTNKKVSTTGMAVYGLKAGKVVSTQVFTDRLGFLQQLGVLPADLTTLQPVKP